MCGIAGYIGKDNVKSTLLNLLKYVEYRGYDSSGIAFVENNNLETVKSVGDIKNLESKLQNINVKSHLGIAHTRWATHGKVNKTNAHPILSADKNWAVVHNGIIENYLELKEELNIKYNYKFTSETDTEVISALLQISNLKGIEALKFACEKLRGSYALAVINKEENYIMLVKNESPLYVSSNKNGSMIASDPICFQSLSDFYYSLNNNEFACVFDNNILFYDKELNIINKDKHSLNFSFGDGNINNYKHYMQKEISQVPEVLKRIKNTYTENKVFEKVDKKILKQIDEIVLVGCGTAYHVCLLGENYFEKISRIKSHGYIASEFRYANKVISPNTLFIFVSQSGETADTLNALEIAKQNNCKTIALTNVLYSTLAKNCDYIFPVCAGPELAVASTKAYTSQATILNMFAKYIFAIRNNSKYILVDFSYNSYLTNTQKDIESLAKDILNFENTFFLGRDLDYVTALESCLKLKEVAYINCSAYPSGEMKHGFLALVTKESLVFVIATNKDLLDKVLNSANEVKARGGKVVLVSQLKVSNEQKNNLYKFISLPSYPDDLMPICSIEFFQWLAYFTSTLQGLNPDKPRNLAKSVTVE